MAKEMILKSMKLQYKISSIFLLTYYTIFSQMNTLKIGDKAPDFTLTDKEGKEISLSDFIGKKVVLYFYPKDNTPGCTKEACMFRDNYEDFKTLGAEVIGVSSDSENSHKKFKSKYNLPFILLSDTKSIVRKSYGVKKTFGFIPGRETFVINENGIIVHRFNSLSNIDKHIKESLLILNK